jgi:hypothetical protein
VAHWMELGDHRLLLHTHFSSAYQILGVLVLSGVSLDLWSHATAAKRAVAVAPQDKKGHRARRPAARTTTSLVAHWMELGDHRLLHTHCSYSLSPRCMFPTL